MTTDFRALCAELVELCSSPAEGVTGLIERWEQVWDLATRARAALAQPEPEGPTDEEIMMLMPQEMHADLAAAARAMTEQAGTDSARVKSLHRIILNRHAVDLARAVLTRWGRPVAEDSSVAQPTDSEVAELVARLRDWHTVPLLEERERAADLLERLSPPQPIPVSERLPGPEDHNSNGECWWLHPGDDECGPFWTLFEGDCRDGCVHWLPAHALPVPTSENA